MGLTAALTVAVMVAIALTLLPALLGFAGPKILRSRIPFLRNRAELAANRESIWHRWGRQVSAHPARYLAISMGSNRYPVLAHKVKIKQAPDASIQEGGAQINYEDQDPRIHEIWLRELGATGVASRMGKYFDEARMRQEPR